MPSLHRQKVISHNALYILPSLSKLQTTFTTLCVGIVREVIVELIAIAKTVHLFAALSF